jgi:threonine dehydrogenase-like Zn-dependent dehydrogenase
MTSTLASVVTGLGECEVREIPLPALPTEGGWMRVQATGVCGSDVGAYLNRQGPERILGHEVVGTVAELGPEAARRWGLVPGDRIMIQEYLPCGHCARCRAGDARLCANTDTFAGGPGVLRFGSTELGVAPGLWGGYSQYMYLHPNTMWHRVPDSVPSHVVPCALPLSNGYEWAIVEGGAAPGKTVVVIGPGQQGLGAVVAAKEAGAALVIVAGLTRDKARLEMAERLGADVTVDSEQQSLVEVVREVTGGEMADTVVDVAAGNEETIAAGVAMLRMRGTMVTATGPRNVNVDVGGMRARMISLKGVRGHSYRAVDWAIDYLARGRFPFGEITAAAAPLSEVDRAIRETGTGDVVHISVDPWA